MRGGTKGSKKPASSSKKTAKSISVSRFGKASAKKGLPAGMTAANAAAMMNVEENDIKVVAVPENMPMVDHAARVRAFDQAKMYYTRLAAILNQAAGEHGHMSVGELWQLYHRFKKQLKTAATGSPALPGVGPYFAQMDRLGAAVAQRAKEMGQADADIMTGLIGKFAESHI